MRLEFSRTDRKKSRVCHVFLAFQCVYGSGNERIENGDEENMNVVNVESSSRI